MDRSTVRPRLLDFSSWVLKTGTEKGRVGELIAATAAELALNGYIVRVR
jgi:hypothetical protein